jgi:GTPase SAR1 family protein
VELVTGSITVPGTTTVVEQYLHDTGGQAVFKDWAAKYWSDISIVMLVYDITRQETFAALTQWLELVKSKRRERRPHRLPLSLPRISTLATVTR